MVLLSAEIKFKSYFETFLKSKTLKGLCCKNLIQNFIKIFKYWLLWACHFTRVPFIFICGQDYIELYINGRGWSFLLSGPYVAHP